MEKIRYILHLSTDKIQRWLFDLPKIGRNLRVWKYRKAFNLFPGEVAIDLGANVGKITKKISKPDVTVYAYEPDPHAFKVLNKTFGNNDNVVCINKAVSDHSGKAKLYFDS